MSHNENQAMDNTPDTSNQPPAPVRENIVSPSLGVAAVVLSPRNVVIATFAFHGDAVLFAKAVSTSERTYTVRECDYTEGFK